MPRKRLISFNAPMIAITVAVSAPGQIQTLDPATSSSMTGGRASAGLFSGLCAGGDAALGGSTTTGAKGKPPIGSSASRRACRRQAKHLLRRQTVATRDLADRRAILQALRDDRRLLLSRPGAAVPRP